jgi:hypothetical protein
MIRRVIYYFFPYIKPIAKFPRRMARKIESVGASQDERVLIERGLARNRDEATLLMSKHNASHALDVIEALHRKSGTTFIGRLQNLFMRIEGSSHHNPDDMRSLREKIPMSHTVRFRERFENERFTEKRH